jgi:hypothetical protein
LRINLKVLMSVAFALVVTGTAVWAVTSRVTSRGDTSPPTPQASTPVVSPEATPATHSLEERVVLFVELYESPPSPERTDWLRVFSANELAFKSLGITEEDASSAVQGAKGILVRVDRAAPKKIEMRPLNDGLVVVHSTFELITERYGSRIGKNTVSHTTVWTEHEDGWKFVGIQVD